ncbi:MAG: hypothetical protein OWQ54_03930 [Sulfolobaceae archaeon]|nr:hypothetical protein [Sulfolobaceae archaeon]
MKWIIIGLLSLLFTFFDYSIGIVEVRVVYGVETLKILSSFPINVIYLAVIFVTEFLVLYFLQKKVLDIYRKWKSFHSVR